MSLEEYVDHVLEQPHLACKQVYLSQTPEYTPVLVKQISGPKSRSSQ
jgi:hypothetical protein